MWGERVLVEEIDRLLDAIDRELDLLSKVALDMTADLDTRGTQDMARWLGKWDPFDGIETDDRQ